MPDTAAKTRTSDDAKAEIKQVLSQTNALLEAMRFSIDSAVGKDDIWKYGSYKTFLRKYNDLARRAAPLLTNPSMLDAFDIDKVRGSGDTTWPQQKELFDLAYSNTLLLKSLLEGEIGYAEDETHKLKDFIEGNLRRAVFTVPERELEVQNAIEALVVGRGMAKGTEYDRETGRVKSSGKESVPDFIFPRYNLCLEVKLSKSPEKLRSIIDEINADIRAYGSTYERQLYVVYDLGTIRDEAEFKRDLEDVPGVSVLIVKH
jgi:hypothetical protein